VVTAWVVAKSHPGPPLEGREEEREDRSLWLFKIIIGRFININYIRSFL
jgi:hypothetical protein